MRDTPNFFIERQFSQTADLISRAQGSRDTHGRWVRGTLTTRQIKVSHDPVGISREASESGVRERADSIFYTSADVHPIQIHADGDGQAGDLIRFRSLFYQVIKLLDWEEYLEVHAELLDPQPDVSA